MVSNFLRNENEMVSSVTCFSEQHMSILKPEFHRYYFSQLRKIVIRRTPQIPIETE
jgi:hypothetical protein